MADTYLNNKEDQPVHDSEDDKDVALVASIFTNLSTARGNVAAKLSKINDYRLAYDCLVPIDINHEVSWEGAPAMRIPFLKSSCLALESEINPLLFDLNPIIRVDTDLRVADPVATLLGKTLQVIHTRKSGKKGKKRKSDYINKWKMAFNYALRDGSSLFMTTFDEDTGFKYSVVAIDRVVCMPSVNADIHDSSAVAIEFNVTRQYLKNKFTEDVVDKVLKYRSPDVNRNYEDVRDDVQPTQMTPIKDGDKDIADMQAFTLTDVYITLDNDEEWIYTIHEPTMTLCKKMKNPYGQRMFVVVKGYSNDVSIFGDCPASIGGYHAQGALDYLINTAIWQQIRQTTPRWAVPESTFKKMEDKMKKNEAKKPGALIPFEMDANSAQLFKTLEMGASGNSLLATYQSVSVEAQGMFGATNPARGQQMQGAATATETLQVVEGGKLLVGSIVANFGDALAEQAQQEYDLMNLFKDNKYLNEIWERVSFRPVEMPGQSDNTLPQSQPGIDPMAPPMDIPKQPVSPEPIPFSLCFEDEDLFWFTANGSFSTSKMITAKRAQDRFGILQQCPEVQADRGLAYEVFRDVLHTNGDQNPEDFLGRKEDWLLRQIAQEEMQAKQAEMQMQQMQQQQQMALQQHQQSLQNPGGGGGASPIMPVQPPPLVDSQAQPIGAQ